MIKVLLTLFVLAVAFTLFSIEIAVAVNFFSIHISDRIENILMNIVIGGMVLSGALWVGSVILGIYVLLYAIWV